MTEEHGSLEARHDSPANITSSGQSTSRQSSPACRRDELQQFDEQGISQEPSNRSRQLGSIRAMSKPWVTSRSGLPRALYTSFAAALSATAADAVLVVIIAASEANGLVGRIGSALDAESRQG